MVPIPDVVTPQARVSRRQRQRVHERFWILFGCKIMLPKGRLMEMTRDIETAAGVRGSESVGGRAGATGRATRTTGKGGIQPVFKIQFVKLTTKQNKMDSSVTRYESVPKGCVVRPVGNNRPLRPDWPIEPSILAVMQQEHVPQNLYAASAVSGRPRLWYVCYLIPLAVVMLVIVLFLHSNQAKMFNFFYPPKNERSREFPLVFNTQCANVTVMFPILQSVRH